MKQKSSTLSLMLQRERTYRFWFTAGFGLLIITLIVEGRVSDTALVSAVSPQLLLAMRIVGAFCAVVLLYLWRDALFPKARPYYRTISLVVLGITTSIWGAMTADYLTWRIANHIKFNGSEAVFEKARFHVSGIRESTREGRNAVLIDPFHVGQSTVIAIPVWQRLTGENAVTGNCIEIMIRKSDTGAVQIINPAAPIFGKAPRATFVNCPPFS